MDEKKARDELFDKMISIAGKAVIEKELSDLPSDEDIDYEFSQEFIKKMDNLIKRKPYNIRFSVFKVIRIAAVAVVFIMIMGVTAYAFIPEFKEIISETFMKWTSKDVTFSLDNEGEIGIRLIYPKYIPDEFTEKHSFQDTDYHIIRYEDVNGNRITYNQMLINKGSSLSIDNEHSEYKPIEIGSYEGKLFISIGTDYPSHVVFNDGEYLYHLSGYCDFNILIAMAESIKE